MHTGHSTISQLHRSQYYRSITQVTVLSLSWILRSMCVQFFFLYFISPAFPIVFFYPFWFTFFPSYFLFFVLYYCLNVLLKGISISLFPFFLFIYPFTVLHPNFPLLSSQRLFLSIYRRPYWQYIFTHTTLYVRNLGGCKVDKYKDGRTDACKRRASLSKKGEWQLNSGDRLKGRNVIDQQVDPKKIRVSLSISQLLRPPLLNERLSNTHTHTHNS